MSLDREATKGALLKFFSVFTFFSLLLVTVNRRSSVERLLGVIIALAFVAGILGVMQSQSRVERIYFFRDYRGPNKDWINGGLTPHASAGYGYIVSRETVGNVYWLNVEAVVGDIFGPFVSSNHFGALAAVTIPLCLGFIIIHTRKLMTFAPGRRGLFATEEGNIVCLNAFVIAVLAWCLYESGARAGLVAALIGMTVAMALVCAKKLAKWRYFVLMLIVLAAGVAGLAAVGTGWSSVSVSGFRAFLAEQLATRTEIWRSALKHAPALWGWGTGLGTFAGLNVSYSDTGRIAYFAHSAPLQWWVEMGLVGSILAVLFVVTVVRTLWRGLRACRFEETTLTLVGIIGALVALCVCSLVDYQLRVYGIALIGSGLLACAIVMCAHAVSEAAPTADEVETIDESVRGETILGKRIVRRRLVILVALAVAVLVFGGYAFLTYRHMQAQLLTAPIHRLLASNNQRRILESARDDRRARLRSIETRAEHGAAMEPWGSAPSYDLAQFLMLAGQIRGRHAAGSSAYYARSVRGAEAYLKQALVRNWADRLPAVSHYLAVTLDEKPDARLAGFEEQMPRFGELGSVYWVGVELAVAAKNPEKAARYAARAVALERNLLPKAMKYLAQGKLGAVSSFVEGLPEDDPTLLAAVAEGIDRLGTPAFVRQFKERVYEQVVAAIGRQLPDTPMTLDAARLAAGIEKNDESIQWYKRYLEHHEEDVSIRLELAEKLFDLRQFAECRRQVRTILRQESRNERARALQARLEAYLEI